MREIKFRAWAKNNKKMIHVSCVSWFEEFLESQKPYTLGKLDDFILMQYTGLKDNSEQLQEVYEGDILDSNGKVKGNIYQMDKEEADTVIQGIGTKTWCETYSRAILLGCTDSE